MEIAVSVSFAVSIFFFISAFSLSYPLSLTLFRTHVYLLHKVLASEKETEKNNDKKTNH